MTSSFIICHKRYFEITKNRCAAELLYFFKQQRKGWFIITIDELRSKFFGTWGRDAIRNALRLLSDLDMVSRRHTRLNGRAWEYQFVSEEATTVSEEATTVVGETTTVVGETTTVVGETTTTYIQDPYLYPLQDPWSEEKEKEGDKVSIQEAEQRADVCVEDKTTNHSECEDIPQDDKCSAASSPLPKKRSLPRRSRLASPLGRRFDVATRDGGRNATERHSLSFARTIEQEEKEAWEIAPGRPYPVFLNWWASAKYKPQGGHWAADALGNAYAEFYNNRSKTAIAIFPQFLEYMQKITDNCNELLNAEFKALLPSHFVMRPESTAENVHRLMERVQSLVEKGASVALPQGIATSACSQSMSFELSEKTEIQPDSLVEPKQLTGNAAIDNAWGCDRTLENEVAKYRAMWKYQPTTRNSIFEWVNKTSGVTLGVDGPELEGGQE